MIIILGDDSTVRYSYLLCLHAPVDEAKSLRKAKVMHGSYAGDLVAATIDSVVRRSLDLKTDYMKYCAAEYASFAEYARKRFLFPPDVINALSSQFPRCAQIIHFYPTQCFIEGEYGAEFLKKLLEPEGAT